jgi:subtilisin family serine protease
MELLNCQVTRLLIGWLALAAGGASHKAIAQEETYYYKKGERVPLKVDPSKAYVLFTPETTQERVEKATKEKKADLKKFDTVKLPTGLNLVQDPPAKAPRWAIIENVDASEQPFDLAELSKDVLYKAPFFLTKDNKQVGISHLVFVKLREPDDKAKLEGLAKDLKVEIVGNNKLMPLWYTLACTKDSAGNALQVANKLFESKNFAAAEPDFLANFTIKCADDAHFDKQWGLKNTGQHGGTAGIDIGVCDAWKVATGKGVKVAVVDQGIQLDHPDLKVNLFATSFDTETGTSPSRVRGSHGTACAGIIGAARANSKLGVAGVAPDATLISISHSLSIGPNTQQELASGLTWAAQNGADVISNSWGHNLLDSALIDDAIDEALTKGRGGKGCVVVFAAGNDNGAIIYPARSNPAILAVGGMSPCGERKSPLSCDLESWWGSCYGKELDIVAPGVLIPTTDRTGTAGYDTGDYTLKFNGTSSATPHVAGVAALILEVNPKLTQKEVATIIEKHGRKVGSYSYQQTSGRPNGDWHKEMGYGLLDAKACVHATPKK